MKWKGEKDGGGAGDSVLNPEKRGVGMKESFNILISEFQSGNIFLDS